MGNMKPTFNWFKTAPFLCREIKQKRDMEEVLSLNVGNQGPRLLREKC